MSAPELQIVIPMAGRGSRFADVGHVEPKPMIRMPDGRRMIELVIDNLRPRRPHRFTFVVRAEHRDGYGLDELLQEATGGCTVLEVPRTTRGAAETVATALPVLSLDEPLMVANCDQFVDLDVEEYLLAGDRLGGEGFLMTMGESHPKWSYAAVGPDGWVTEVAEKRVISDRATVGIYNFARVGDYARGCEAMVAADRRTNGEFYVAPVYNELVAEGARIGLVGVEPLGGSMHGLGTPEDLELFRRRAATPAPRPAVARSCAVVCAD